MAFRVSLIFCADIDIELCNRNGLALVAPVDQVNRFNIDNAGITSRNRDRCSGKDTRINSADWLKGLPS